MTDEETIESMQETIKQLGEQGRRLHVSVLNAYEMNAQLASRLGRMEQQRNHSRWKYGRAKRRWREEREATARRLSFVEGLAYERARMLGLPGFPPADQKEIGQAVAQAAFSDPALIFKSEPSER